MAKKRKTPLIGIIFDYNSGWMGGTYYILNLLNAIATLPVIEQPAIVIYGEKKEGFNLVQKEIQLRSIHYKRVTNIYTNKLIVLLNKMARRLRGINLFQKGPSSKREVIFPSPVSSFFKDAPHRLFWIPDFQEKYYPQFFSEADISFRQDYNNELTVKQYPVIFSSNSVLADFRKFYPGANNPVFLLPFVVSLPDISDVNFEMLKEKYSINTPFFFTPNQFWVHKNHNVIVEAAAIVKTKGYNCEYLFSGKEFDPRCPEYTQQLKDRMTALQLKGTIQFLGFLDRRVLLKLMSESIAVIQPSLFEGWSTVVEDAKALNKTVIASSLPVHIEQMGNKGIYFEALNANELADRIIEQLINGKKITDWSYSEKKAEFGRKFISIVEEILH
ncbi:MAG: glycosyltransferase [Ferruginibacter sp.]